MSNRTLLYFLMIAVTVAGAGGFLASRSFSAADTTVSALAKETHFHGIAVDPSDPSRVYLVTHHGLYAVAPDGSASRISSKDIPRSKVRDVRNRLAPDHWHKRGRRPKQIGQN